MSEILENNRVVKAIIIMVMALLIIFMIFSFPNSTAQENDNNVVSIR